MVIYIVNTSVPSLFLAFRFCSTTLTPPFPLRPVGKAIIYAILRLTPNIWENAGRYPSSWRDKPFQEGSVSRGLVLKAGTK